ncbi:Transcriptional regulator [Chytridiales sp. JEL 0842]|nr:Transcriptional regulator [Chytridiales sp. JEL 0842]
MSSKPSNPSPLPRPDLNFNDIPYNTDPKLFQQYTPSALAAAGKLTTDVPPAHDIQKLTAELDGLKNAATQREQIIKSNMELVQQWLKKHEKLVASAASSSLTGVSGSLEGSLSPTLSASGAYGSSSSLNQKLDKKLKLSQTSATSSTPFGMNSSSKAKIKDEYVAVKEEDFYADAGRSMSPQIIAKKRKRDKDSADIDEGSVLFRKTEDGSVKIAITQNGKMKIKIAASSPPPPPFSSGSSSSISSNPIYPLHQTSIPKPLPRSGTPKIPKSKSAAKKHAEKTKIKKKKGSTTDLISEAETPEPESGGPLEGDYSKAKAPPNQIPVAQFWTFCESQFFRPLVDEDFTFLDDMGDQVTPYITPLLGRNYLEQWAEEENAMLPYSDPSIELPNGRRSDSSLKIGGGEREYEERDDTVFGGDVYLGSLTERILSTLREEGMTNLVRNEIDEEDPLSLPKPAKFRSTTEMMVLEDRLKNEIRHLGLIGDDDVGCDHKDGDEVSAELRRLQGELRDQVSVNCKMKQKLKEVAVYYRGWEQYNSVLDALSKQIEVDFLKRYKQAPKNKKRSKSTQTIQVINEQTLETIDKRKWLIDNIGALFPPERVTIPTKSIYAEPKIEPQLQTTNSGNEEAEKESLPSQEPTPPAQPIPPPQITAV